MRKQKVRHDHGFSMIELLVVMTIIVIGSTVALIQLSRTRQILDATAVANEIVSQLRYAREVAIDQRRNVLIEFIDPDVVKITRLDPGGATTVLSSIRLRSGYIFALPGGGIGDTPEGFGNANPVSFGASNGGTFLGDGTFVDSTGLVLNGTVFTMGGTGNGSARAVTLTGATGRIKEYWLSNNVWAEITQ